MSNDNNERQSQTIQSNGIVDLHAHSNLSDGSLSPEELVEVACCVGLKYLALTDHDTMAGVERAMAAAPPSLTIIPGIEFSALYPCELHILGYFRQDNYRTLQPFIEQNRQERIGRNSKILEKLNQQGFAITVEEVRAEAGKRVYGRPHIAAVMVKKGYCKNMENAFAQYLGFGKKAYVSRSMPMPADCVRAISEAGGVAVIAHPVHIKMKLKKIKMLIDELIPSGLAGLEAYYTDNTVQDTRKFLELAAEYGLIATGGSDFHGEYKRGLRLSVGRGNLRIPDSVADTILHAITTSKTT